MPDWVLGDYIYKRAIKIQSLAAPIPSSQPVTVTFPYSLLDNKKLRVGLEDLEVEYQGQAIYRDVIATADKVYVTFQLQDEIESLHINQSYSIYTGNPTLATPPIRASQIAASYYPDTFASSSTTTVEGVPDWAYWPNRIIYNDTLISYTRPGEHWKEGYTQVPQARASTKLIADRMRLICEVGPDQGIIQVRTNTDEWQEIDLYSDTVSVRSVFEVVDLPRNKLNELTVLATGRSRYPSQDFKVNVQMVDYNYDFISEDLGEEVKPLSWSSYVGGV